MGIQKYSSVNGGISGQQLADMGVELTKKLGMEVKVDGPYVPAQGSSINVYVARSAIGDFKAVIRDYRRDPTLNNREVQIKVDGTEKIDEVTHVILSYFI